MKTLPSGLPAVFFTMIVLSLGTIACKTTAAPFTYTDTFNVSSDHFREIREGPWEIIDNTYYCLFLDHDEKKIYVRGRESGEGDTKDNFDFRIEELADEWFPGKEGSIKVHVGFLKRYKAVRSVLFDAVDQYADYAVRLSGFSLGGTWTQLFLLDVLLHWPERDILAIFYAPANPWRKLPKEYQEKLKLHTIFVSSVWDPVTWMEAVGFHRYGYDITIGKWWRILPPQHKARQMIRALDEKFPAPDHREE